MRFVRQLLQSGMATSGVAARVGYSMVSNFSRAFSRFHGIGPREFQQLEGPDEVLRVG
jgi:AraC-like DNA-binding protein